MIKLDLWDVINSRAPQERDIPESLEKPEKLVDDKAEASEAESSGNGAAADPSERWD